MFSQQLTVRFYETDALKHVSNTVVVGWFESGREPIFRLFTPELDVHNWPLILASYKVDFHQQIFYGQDVELRTYISRIGNSSFDCYQEAWQKGKKSSSGTCTLVHFDYQTEKATPIPEHVRIQLEQHYYNDNSES